MLQQPATSEGFVTHASDHRRHAVDRALEQFLARDRGTDRAFGRRVTRDRRPRPRRGRQGALLGFARRFDGVWPPAGGEPDEMRAAAAARSGAMSWRAIRQAARHIARVARAPDPAEVGLVEVMLRACRSQQRVEPLRARRVLRAGRPLSAALLAADDRDSGACRRRVARSSRCCPRPEPAVMARRSRPASRGSSGSAGPTRSPRWPTAPATMPARGQDRRTRQPLRRGRQGASSRRDCAIDFYAGPTEIVIVAGTGRPGWIAADLVAQAEHDPDARSIFITWSRALAARVADCRRAAGGRPRRS